MRTSNHHNHIRDPILSSRLANGAANGDKPFVLVVDDVSDNIQFLAARLRGKGFQVAAASNGAEALKAIAAKAPDLILLDVQMPEMDGFEVCRRLKENPETASIPVIFLTARTEVEDILEGFGVGAVDYVTKPFHAAELLTRVRTHLELKYTQDALLLQNAELEQANAQLVELNNEKNEFLGVAAHDLKNPLGGIRWLAELMIDNPNLPQERVHEVLTNIVGTTERMVGIVKNLLDVNAIEQGKLSAELEPVNALIVAADVAANFSEQAARKDIKLHVEKTVAAREATVLASEPLLLQAIENLVSNAIKYSPRATNVTIAVSKGNPNEHGSNKRTLDDAMLLITVRDEGPGLTDNDKQKLFTKFSRLSARPTAGEHSTGLGLFIVKKLIEAMSGRVWCESSAGEGATFAIVLPKIQSVGSGSTDTTSIASEQEEEQEQKEEVNVEEIRAFKQAPPDDTATATALTTCSATTTIPSISPLENAP